MDLSRRAALIAGVVSSTVAVAGTATARPSRAAGCLEPRVWRRGPDGQREADLGNGTFRNPVLSGDRPDPNILKDADDYYATFSSFEYYPGVVIWHSRDLVNWRPLGPALARPLGSVWALDIAKHDGRYFIYVPIFNAGGPGFPTVGLPCKIFVIHAPSMAGPWSDPVDMGIDGYIDPGHAVGEDGKRYLFLNAGARVRISDDGLGRAGPIEQVYGGWPIPEDMIVEAPALEGPKVLRHGGWFYLFSGQGGTAGPPTSHMVIVARSRSIDGPWENCPRNPIVHTASRAEPWWSRGHGTPVADAAGNWWLAYHGYENGLRTLGRQMLLEPFVWDADGWPRMLGGDLSRPLPTPAGSRAKVPTQLALSTNFGAADFGGRLAFFAPSPDYLDRASVRRGQLTLTAQGTGSADASPLAFIAGDRSYEVAIDLEIGTGAEGGLLLFYDRSLFCGLGARPDRLIGYKLGRELGYPSPGPSPGRRLSLRVVNDEETATFYVGESGKAWRKSFSLDVSGYNQNMAGGFMSLRPAIYAAGSGNVVFANLRYRGR